MKSRNLGERQVVSGPEGSSKGKGSFGPRIGTNPATSFRREGPFFPRNVPHAWKNTGSETARAVFLYTPAAAGGYVEELLKRPAGSMDDDERRELRERYRWEVVGPNPL